jgi:23S rRNA U2552 (ribose-2'-O)-methylase RlmE/FtsJ
MKEEILTSSPLIQRKLLIITGHSGSGVHALSVLIREQLKTHQDMTNSLLDYVEINLLDTMAVGGKDENITDIRILDDLEALVMSDFSSAVKMHTKCDKNSTSHVTVVTLTTAAQVLLNQAELLNIVLEGSKKNSPHTYVSIGAVVAVIAPKALLTESVTSTDW